MHGQALKLFFGLGFIIRKLGDQKQILHNKNTIKVYIINQLL